MKKKKKAKFPYDYRSFGLTSVKGSATFTGNPSPELLNAINELALAAYKKLKKI